MVVDLGSSEAAMEGEREREGWTLCVSVVAIVAKERDRDGYP